MDWKDIEALLDAAIGQFRENDLYLLDVDANERSLTHQLATYMKPLFAPYDVDCEYNRDGIDPKSLPDALWKQVPNDDTHASTVFPDIIVHKRGNNNGNLLVIEAKKSTAGAGNNKLKLDAYVKDDDLRYQHAVLLKFCVQHDLNVIFERVGGRANV